MEELNLQIEELEKENEDLKDTITRLEALIEKIKDMAGDIARLKV